MYSINIWPLKNVILQKTQISSKYDFLLYFSVLFLQNILFLQNMFLKKIVIFTKYSFPQKLLIKFFTKNIFLKFDKTYIFKISFI